MDAINNTRDSVISFFHIFFDPRAKINLSPFFASGRVNNLPIKVLVLGIMSFNLAACDSGNEQYLGENSYRLGKFKKILDGGDEYNFYKGLIYENGLGVEQNIGKARSLYKTITSRAVRENRVFMLCFLYCSEELDNIYAQLQEKDERIMFVYALELIGRGRSCYIENINHDSCALANTTVNTFVSETSLDMASVYYLSGYESYMKVVNQMTNYGVVEYPYYFIKKSALEGNNEAINFLERLPSGKSFVPKLINK